MAEITQTQQAPITNPALVQAMENLKANNTPGNEQLFVQALRTARFYVPAEVNKIQAAEANPDGTVELKDKPQIKFMLFNNSEGKKFFPLFTDMDEFHKWEGRQEKQQLAVLPFRELANIIKKNPAPDSVGIVVNPFGHNVMVPNDSVARMADTQGIPANSRIRLGFLNEEPTDLLNALREHMTSVEVIEAAHLRVMQREDAQRPNLLLIVDLGSDEPDTASQKAIFDEIAAVARGQMTGKLQGWELAIVPLSNQLGQAGLKAQPDAAPFYSKN